MPVDPNPYASPKHDFDAPVVATGETQEALESTRRAHLNAEANIRGLGSLMYFGAAVTVLGGVVAITKQSIDGLISIAVGGALGLGAYWLRNLDARGRMVYTLITALGILGTFVAIVSGGNAPQLVGRMLFPILFVIMLWSSKASTVMTPHYRDVVIPATPHIKRKTSIVLIVVLVILVLALIAVGVVAAG